MTGGAVNKDIIAFIFHLRYGVVELFYISFKIYNTNLCCRSIYYQIDFIASATLRSTLQALITSLCIRQFYNTGF